MRWRAVVAVGTLGAGLMLAPSAGAQPPAPSPVPAPPPAEPLFPLAQSDAPTQVAGGLPALPDLSGQTPNEFLLGQHAAPAPPGQAPVAPINLNPFNNTYLLPQHLVPSAPGQGELFGIPPGQELADANGMEFLKRLYDTYRAGGLEGGLLGQRGLDSLNKPLPVEPPQHP